MANHISVGVSNLLCGSQACTAWVNGSTCRSCNSRFDKILDLIIKVSEERAGAKEAKKLLTKFNLAATPPHERG